ncbi:envelope stress response membrane protein PspB [Dickeya sp. CFBP 2040]|uniref:Envelope stress response membrane protein PspB n=1 Tax=Dickeya poaceiphila TaxID=568768 RepID=A0A5B8I5M2_9GAMM|nr:MULTISPECIES: envelope stress response membrane protein PspB [Dickeya]NKI73764.1 envelope stress response membrane protein PspB [Dickeya sp. CFBP 2040]QDX29823.1 envelope stress response membrane protein PspB [Dickeya poaceiphila]
MGALVMTMIPLTVFLLFVAPLWLWLHYSQRRRAPQWDQAELQRLARLTEDAQRMRDRIEALEQILDAEHPNWRQS